MLLLLQLLLCLRLLLLLLHLPLLLRLPLCLPLLRHPWGSSGPARGAQRGLPSPPTVCPLWTLGTVAVPVAGGSPLRCAQCI